MLGIICICLCGGLGLFDVFKKKTDNTTDQATEEFKTSGWDAITAELERVYVGQTNPKHYGTLIKWRLGGDDPLDGISIYDAGDHWHFVTFGMTELYDKESENKEFSGYGYEMTLKLIKGCYANEEGEIKCICGILQTLARLTFTQNEIFGPYEYIYTGQTTGIDADQKSKLTGFICAPDSTLNTIDTPHGKVEFLEFIGMTDAELKTLNTVQSVKDIHTKIGSDVTDYSRESYV